MTSTSHKNTLGNPIISLTWSSIERNCIIFYFDERRILAGYISLNDIKTNQNQDKHKEHSINDEVLQVLIPFTQPAESTLKQYRQKANRGIPFFFHVHSYVIIQRAIIVSQSLRTLQNGLKRNELLTVLGKMVVSYKIA